MVRFQNFLTFLAYCLRNYWSNLHQTLVFVYAVVLCSQLSKFQNFLTFLHFSQELIFRSWSNFDLCSCCGTLQPIAKFQTFLPLFCIFLRNYWCYLDQTLIFVYAVAFCSQLQSIRIFSLFCFFSGTTGVILIKLGFLFMLWHSVTNCKVSRFSSVFCIFLKNYWSYLDQNFDFYLCCGTLQLIVKFPNFLHFVDIFLRNYWSYLDKTLNFVHAVAFCSQLQSSKMFFTFWHFSQELLVLSWSKLWILFMPWHSAASCKVSKCSSLFAFFSGTTWSNLDKTLKFLHAVVLCSQLQSFKMFFTFCCISLMNYWSYLDKTLIFVHAVALCN